MEKFVYVTQKKKGARFERRTVSAESMRDAERDLMARNIPCLVIDKAKTKSRAGAKATKKHSVPFISLKERMSFAQSMEQCQEIDMGLLVALDICREMAFTKKFAAICGRMRTMISEGTTLHDAMKSVGVFDPLVLGLVKAGEKSGFLAKSFLQIKQNYRRTDTIRRKVIKLMSYPLVVIFVATLCIFFLMWKTVPTFVGLFSTAGMELPMPTKILMVASSFTTTYPYLVFLGIVAFGFGMLKLPLAYRACPWAHAFILRIPVFGKLQKLLIQETFTRTFLNLQLAGLKIIDALSLCRSVSGCYPYKGAIARAILTVSAGSSLMTSLEAEKDIFGVIVLRTLGFGEKSGKTEKVLEPLAEALGIEIMDTIDTLNTIIEPVLTLLIGSVVLLILLALFIPIFSLPKLL
jgi:type IV pilus assembly protein PilC